MLPTREPRLVFPGSLILLFLAGMTLVACGDRQATAPLAVAGTWQVAYLGDPASGVKILTLRQHGVDLAGTVTDNANGTLTVTGTIVGRAVHLQHDPASGGRATFRCLTTWDATLSDGSHLSDGTLTAVGDACPGYAGFGAWSATRG
jgi:hypothetical protein